MGAGSRGPRRGDPCYRCGGPSTSMDHVFPRSLYARLPEPGITVPACAKCQAATQPDEDYFRQFVTSTSYRHETARRLWPRIRRSLRRDRRAWSTFLASMRKVDVATSTGIYLGTVDGLEADQERINRALQKIVRGLWCVETGGRIMQVDDLEWGFGHTSPLDRQIPEDTADAIRQLPLRSAGPEVNYRFHLAPEEPRTTLSWMDFYGSVMFAVSTRPPASPDPII